MINATVGILTFNSAKYLDNCLKSVKNFKEILIFDGGSNDNTLNIAKKYNCIFKKQPKKFKLDCGCLYPRSIRNLLVEFISRSLYATRR